MKKISAFIFICFTITICNNLYSIDNAGTIRAKRFLNVDTFYYTGNYQASLTIALAEPELFKKDSDYDKFSHLTLTNYNFATWNLEQTARAYAALQNCDSAVFYLKKLFAINGYNIGYITRYEYDPLKNCAEWKIISDSCIKLFSQGEKMTNQTYFIELLKLRDMNGFYRYSLASFFDYLPTSYVDQMDSKQSILDSIVVLKTDSLIQKFGFPNFSNTGNEGAQLVFDIIHHSSTEMILKYQSEIEKIYRNGLIGKDAYAKYVDRVLVNTNCPQKYGTQYWYDEKNKQYYFEPVEDTENLNKLRNEMSLETIEEKSKQIGQSTLVFKSYNQRH